MPRWKFVALGSALIIGVCYGAAIIHARYFSGAHTVDLGSAIPLVLGILDTLRKGRGDQDGSRDAFG